MTKLEARIIRIEQTLGLAPVELEEGMVVYLHLEKNYSIQEWNEVAKKEAIDKEFANNMVKASVDEWAEK